MDRLATSTSWATATTAEAVALPRRHVLAVAALVCIPIPLFSIGAMLLPLPQLLERAAASFVSIAAPSSGKPHVIRELETGRHRVPRR
jgi:hypothetical protein